MQNSRPHSTPTPQENDEPDIEDDTLTKILSFIKKTLNLMKEQQDLTKITIKDSTDLIAKKAGIRHINHTIDNRILDSALLELKKLRRIALKEKIEKPLRLKKTIKEKELKKISSPKMLKNLLKQKSSPQSSNSAPTPHR